MISKIYFPRLVMTVSSVMTNLTDFLISVVFLVGLMIWYRFTPPLRLCCFFRFLFFWCSVLR